MTAPSAPSAPSAPTPPAPTPITRNPRRPPAHASVSLRHSPPASDKANPPSSISPRLHPPHHASSGESSDAAGWFESTNNGRAHDASFVDNDPPFRLHASSSSDRTPPDVPALPYRPSMLALPTDGSSTDDFRSVIDDLTVANKRLKHRLRRYERVHDAHLQHEKLFEVRFHALPAHKKRELEDTLRRFAASLDDPDRPDVAVPALPKEPTASSTSRFAESGYVSMSASGRNSSTPSNGPSIPNDSRRMTQSADSRRMTKSAYHRQQQSIQSYLHDMPAGLRPHHDAPLSDKARKKLVVRRLEQIFAGKRSAPGSHPHPMQQEEVAQSAATADRREREATGRDARPEGHRTALIMPDADHLLPPPPHDDDAAAAAAAAASGSGSGSGSPDQRPTRPLDLDPYRAQVPAANMLYFRHLGFSPPDMTTSTESHDDHGWLYLNLLINLAQLHTLNVTPEIVKDAIAEYSTQFELSADGRKVRWKGGHDFSKDSSDGSPDQPVNSPYAAMTQRSPQKSPKTGPSTSMSGSELPNRFAYKPLFFRRDSSEDDHDFYAQTDSSGSPFPQQRGDSSALGSVAVHSNPAAKRRDDGPMIFYNKARFCTDLTGDRIGASLTLPENYNPITSHPLGADLEASSDADMWEPRGPLADQLTDDKIGAQTPSSLSSLGFSPDDLHRHITASSDAMDFEASGLGGVQPDDNFSIRVQRSQIPQGPSATHHRRTGLYPSKIQAILGGQRRSTSPKPTIKESMLSAVRRDMPSSILPPPSFYPFDSHSSGDLSDDEESTSSGSSDSGGPSTGGPSTTLQLLNVAPPVALSDHTGLTSEASEYSADSDSNVSIDLLATARQQDPDTVRAFEREYDAAAADHLAEEIVAGSSAATAGGGSGFNSPASASALRHGSRRSAKNLSSNSDTSQSPRTRRLKRARTESLAAVVKKSQRTE